MIIGHWLKTKFVIKFSQVGGVVFFQSSFWQAQSCPTKRAPDAGDSAQISRVSHALSFFWLDGFAVPAPAQVTQTVGRLT
jgi:hypothetical protein